MKPYLGCFLQSRVLGPLLSMMLMASAIVTGMVGAGVQPALAATSASGTLYFTTFSGPPNNVHKVSYSWNGTNLTLGTVTNIASIDGADGIIFAPDGSLLVGGQGPVVYKISTTNGTYVSMPTGGPDAYHLSMDPSLTKVWAAGIPGEPATLPLDPFGPGTPQPLTGGVTAIDSLAWVPGMSDNVAFFTSSGPGGTGDFGELNTTTLTTTVLLSSLPAAHGMVYDPFSKTLVLFGSNHVTQIDPNNPTALYADLSVGGGVTLDQGAVDGKGHALVASNSGDLVMVDYSASGNVSDPSTKIDMRYLADSLDDVAPLIGLGGEGGGGSGSSLPTVTVEAKNNLGSALSANVTWSRTGGPSPSSGANVTAFSLPVNTGDNVTLTAPLTTGGCANYNVFNRWQVDSANQTAGQLTVTVPNVASNVTATAYYNQISNLGPVLPALDINQVGTPHTATASIGVPVAGVPVTFALQGDGNLGAANTDSSGVASLTYTSDVSRTDTIYAYIDSDGSGVFDPLCDPVSSANATKYWINNFYTGGGKVTNKTAGTWTFGGNVGIAGENIVGNIQLVHHAKHGGTISYHSDYFTFLNFIGPPTKSPPSTHSIAIFTGTFTSNRGNTVVLTFIAEDNGEPGSHTDKIGIKTGPVTASGTILIGSNSGTSPFVNPVPISGGNLQIHDLDP